MSVNQEVRWDSGAGFFSTRSCFSGGRLEAREVVNGGAYRAKLMEEVVRDCGWSRGFRLEVG